MKKQIDVYQDATVLYSAPYEVRKNWGKITAGILPKPKYTPEDLKFPFDETPGLKRRFPFQEVPGLEESIRQRKFPGFDKPSPVKMTYVLPGPKYVTDKK